MKISKFIQNTLIGFLCIVFFIFSALATYLLLDLFKFNLPILQRNQYPILNTFEYRDIKLPKAFIVQSGSMEPAIKTGSIVITKKEEIYNQGEIISYTKGSKNIITHRIQVKNYPDGINSDPVYLTAGDANEDFDSGSITSEQIVGKVVLTLPYLGYVADFAKQPYGFLLLVIVPATIVIYEELKGLLKEIFKTLSIMKRKLFRRKGRTLKYDLKGTTLKAKNNGLPKASAIVPIFGAALVFTGLASSFFSDIEISIGNLFQAGDWSPPIAQTLVINEVLYKTNCTVPQNKQWIEIWNGFDFTVNLQDWSLRDGEGNTIQIINSVTPLAPGKFALLSKSSATWNDQCYGPLLSDVVQVQLGGTINIATESGAFKLLDSNLDIVDEVFYGPDPASASAGLNFSFEREVLGQKTGGVFNAIDFSERKPSIAGFAIPQNQDVVINEFIVHDGGTGLGNDWVELYNKTGSSVDISGWTLRDTTGIFHTVPASTTLLNGDWYTVYNSSNRLGNSGDKIYLFDSGSNLKDGISYFQFLPSVGSSVGRNTDGGTENMRFHLLN